MNLLSKTLQAAALAATLASAMLASPLAAANEPSAWDKFKSFAHDKKNDAVAEGKKLIAATDKNIDQLKQEMAKSSGEARKAHEQNMKELQAKRKAAQAELARLEKSAASTWDATKEGFAKAYQDLQQSYEKAKAGKASK